MLSHDEVTEQSNELLDMTIVKVVEVRAINFDPHPYTIGAKHLERNDSMFLGESQIHEMERKYGPMCAWESGRNRCTKTYDEHTSDTVGIVQLQRDATQDEVKGELKKLLDLFDANGVDGFVFLETEEGYRVQ